MDHGRLVVYMRWEKVKELLLYVITYCKSSTWKRFEMGKCASSHYIGMEENNNVVRTEGINFCVVS